MNEILNHLSIAVIIVNSNGKIIFSNTKFQRLKEHNTDLENLSDFFKSIIVSKKKRVNYKNYIFKVNTYNSDYIIEVYKFKINFDNTKIRKLVLETIKISAIEKLHPTKFTKKIEKIFVDNNAFSYFEIKLKNEIISYGEKSNDNIEILENLEFKIQVKYISNISPKHGSKIIINAFTNLIILYSIFFEECKKMDEYDEKLLDTEKFSIAGQMMMGMLHEINNPLTAGIINIEMILKDEKYYNKNRILKIANQFYRIKEIIEIFRGAFKKENKFSLFLLNDAILKAKNFLLRKTDNIILNIENTNEVMINGDMNKIIITLINLFSNAFDAIKDNPHGVIQVSTFKYRNNIVLKISDNGIGMSKEVVKKIFNPFFTTKQKYGLGHGLFFVSSVCTIHNIKISVISKKDYGTTFTLIIPIYQKGGQNEV